MNIYLIEAETCGMGEEEIAAELSVMGEVLLAIGGRLLNSDRLHAATRLLGYVRAESGQAVEDVFAASDFVVLRIEFVGSSRGIRCLSLQDGRKTLDLIHGFVGLDGNLAEGLKLGLS